MLNSTFACTGWLHTGRVHTSQIIGAASSAGRAPRSQCGGQRFDPVAVHQSFPPGLASAPHHVHPATRLHKGPLWRKQMEIIGWIVFGLIIGALAKLVMPGRDPGGIIVTM